MTDSSQPELDPMLGQLREAVQAGLPVVISDLGGLVRIPSVSWDGFDPTHVLASAKAVRELLAATGVFDTVEIARAPIDAELVGQPAVLARRAARNGKPTVLLYAHHDVQPPGSPSDWESAPFEPTVRGDRLYGRGAADDKAGVMAHVAAIRAFTRVLGDDFDLGLVAFIEGEEEFGSRSFANFIVKHRDALAADVIIVADSDNWDTVTPSLTVALRGNVAFKLSISTLAHASHSGMFGGAAPDAMLAAIRLLATMHAPDGSVAVDGLTATEATTPDYSAETFASVAALLPGVDPIGRGSVLSRLWYQPAITITGIDAPTVANASNTLVPSVTVKISARIAPGQDAASAFAAIEKHLHAHSPFGAHLEISDVDLGNPFLVNTSGWAVDLAMGAMRDAWGTEPMQTGVGGSIPFISDLADVFPSAQILVTGVEDPDSRAHSPNESLHLGVFQRAILTEAVLLAKLESRGYNCAMTDTAVKIEGKTAAHGVGLTDAAADKVRSLMSQEGRDDLRLRLAVQPGGCSGLIYQLYFDERILDGDVGVEFGEGVEVVVDKMSVPYLDGATIDFEDTIQKQGFTIDNPNAQGSCACGDSFH